ncbi:MAG: hypothetical protein IKC15_03770 [Kiritimatiellae bacterium]|nr:hypothetical protein [Kiritimatiellia bacterium]
MRMKHRIPHVAALACALPFFVVAVAMAVADSGLDGGAAELREGAFRVRFRDCPTCEMRMRVSPEASIAFVNTSRVGAADRPAVAARAFAVLRMADAARRALAADGGAVGEDMAAKALADAARLCGEGEERSLAQKDPKATVRFRGVAGAGGKAMFLVLRNDGDKSFEFNIPFAALGFKDRVAVFDLVEMAELDLDADALTLSVPAGGERRFRLDALPVAEKGGAKR